MKCLPCDGKLPKLTTEEALIKLETLPNWSLFMGGTLIYRHFIFKDFAAALNFINKVAKIAEEENHHPDIHLTHYSNVRIELFTHSLQALTGNDFILAVKIDEVANCS